MNDDSDDNGINILDVKLALEDVFKGCDVTTPPTMGGSFHATVTFYEYEIRVILSGRRSTQRDIHFRFLQHIRFPGKQRKPIKVLLNEVHTQDPAELVKAIKDTRAYLLGIVQAINQVLRRKSVPQVHEIDDLLR